MAETSGVEEEAKLEEKTQAERPKKQAKRKRARGASKPFPSVTFEEALQLANAIQDHAAGQKVRRLTLFDKMGKSPSSGPSRSLVTNSAKYGLTEGSYTAEYLSLTKDGAIASNNEASGRDLARARFRLAIEQIPPFKQLYERLVNSKLPSREVLRDYAGEFGVDEEDRGACVDMFLGNAKFVGLLKLLSGAERIVSIDHVLEELPIVAPKPGSKSPLGPSQIQTVSAEGTDAIDFSKVCFLIAPIGEEDSEPRKHSDMVLSALVERAVDEQGLQVVRADKITKPGMISAQVIEYLLKSKVVVADLSFHNPNVFYELALRHVIGLPTVHIIRTDDHVPFDLANFRTVKIDTTDKYTLVARLDSYRSEIANHVRQAIDEGIGQDNPIRAYHPSLRVQTD